MQLRDTMVYDGMGTGEVISCEQRVSRTRADKANVVCVLAHWQSEVLVS